MVFVTLMTFLRVQKMPVIVLCSYLAPVACMAVDVEWSKQGH